MGRDIIQYSILAIVQGITEFIPISSSAHLAILEQVFQIKEKLTLTIFLHFGSVLALILFMWGKLKKIIQSEHKLLIYVVIASIFTGIIGLTLKQIVEKMFETTFSIGIALAFTGIILYLTKNAKEKKNNISLLDAILIGIVQGIAVIPGISRSGITISTGIFLGIEKLFSAHFSLLLSIVSILCATLLEIKKIALSFYIIYGIILSFIVSYLSIVLLVKLVKIKRFFIFSFYCWLLSAYLFIK